MYAKVQHISSFVASVTLIVYRNIDDVVDSLISRIDGKLLIIGGYNKKNYHYILSLCHIHILYDKYRKDC